MQSQEHIYEPVNPIATDKHTINTDPREQVQQPVEERLRSYTEGYDGRMRRDIWNQREKLRIESGRPKSMSWFWLLVVLPCATFFLGSFLTIFLGGIVAYGGTVVLLSGGITLLLILIGTVLWIERIVLRRRQH